MNTSNVNALTKGREPRVAIYCRLSKDDETEGESASIGTQRDMLLRHCDEQGWMVRGMYQDDGFSGLSMDRPGLKQLMDDAKLRMFDMVITKDLSRLSRNYLDTGHLIEQFFPKHKVRYIALNDSVDSDEDSDIAPFRYILGEMVSKDTSKKVHSAYVTKAKQGKFTGCVPPLGYKKSLTNHNQLEIDEDTSWIIEKIFTLANEGHGPLHISHALERDQVPSPTWWNRQKGIRNRTSKFELLNPDSGRFVWGPTAIRGILVNPAYIGSISGQKALYRFKHGWVRNKDPDEWITVPGMHPPIISEDIFYSVAEQIKNRKRITANGRFHLFSGLLRCGSCSLGLSIKKSNCKKKYHFYACTQYNQQGAHHCTQHRVVYTDLYDTVLSEIRTYAKLALENASVITDMLNERRDNGAPDEQTRLKKNIGKSETRLKTLDSIISKIYEDVLYQKISEETFNMMLTKTQAEQTDLKERLKDWYKRLDDLSQTVEDPQKWVNLISQFQDLQELDRPTLNRLIKKIVVHEVETDGKPQVKLEIYYNFLEVSVPVMKS